MSRRPLQIGLSARIYDPEVGATGLYPRCNDPYFDTVLQAAAPSQITAVEVARSQASTTGSIV